MGSGFSDIGRVTCDFKYATFADPLQRRDYQQARISLDQSSKQAIKSISLGACMDSNADR